MAKKKTSSPYNLIWLIGIVLVALIGGGYLGLDGCNDQADQPNSPTENHATSR